MEYKERFNTDTFIPEVEIEGQWISYEFIVDGYKILGHDEFVKVCELEYPDDVSAGILEYIKSC